MLLKKFTMFRDASAHTFAPKAETGGLEFATHHINDMFLGEPCALFDFLECRAILPRVPNDTGDFFNRWNRFHHEQCELG